MKLPDFQGYECSMGIREGFDLGSPLRERNILKLLVVCGYIFRKLFILIYT